MSIAVSTQAPPVGTKLVVETAADETPRQGATGAAGTLYQVEVDNAANSGDPAYLKVYDLAAVTVGTDPPNLIFEAAPGAVANYVIPHGWPFTDLSFACVTTPGTAGATGPTNPVVVRMVAS